MKKFKVFDVWFNVGLIVIFTITTILSASDFLDDDLFFLGYFIVGGWQVISMIVHLINKQDLLFNYQSRIVYNWITLISIISMPFGGFWILFFIAPFMAIFYTILCYRETYIKMKRPLDDLK
jgi:hypothetical protein